MNRQVIVIGGGNDARWVANELLALGHEVQCASRGEVAQPPAEGCQIYPQCSRLSLSGHVGDFQLSVESAAITHELAAGAIVVAVGNERLPSPMDETLVQQARILSAQQFGARLHATPRLSAASQQQHILFALDLTMPSGKEAVVETLRLALQARLAWRCEVSLLYRELQVDDDQLEALTRAMRDEGIVFHRLLAEMPAADETGVRIAHADGNLHGDYLVLAPHFSPRSDNRTLAGVLQIDLGDDGYFQQLNVRSYRPGLSNRKGIFLAGRCHLDTDDGGARADARQAAANVDALLTAGELDPESVIAFVDSTKCIRCLTCIRTCPHAAVELAPYGQVTAAQVIELACFGCGACAANCPVQAIALQGSELPVWMQEGVTL